MLFIVLEVNPLFGLREIISLVFLSLFLRFLFFIFSVGSTVLVNMIVFQIALEVKIVIALIILPTY
jgi:hypothetical protein